MTMRIPIDAATFDPWKVQALTHQLSDHPMLQLDALLPFAQRHEKRGLVRSHSDKAKAGSSFHHAPDEHPNPWGAVRTLEDVDNAHAWVSLLNIQADPEYRRLVDDILDELRPVIQVRDPGLCYRAGWIFIASPGAVTPFHMDQEHNFIMQIRGNKRLYVWDPLDRSIVSERGQELFHAKYSRELVTWREEFLAKAKRFDLEPGLGGYMPSTAPHLVENGAGASITVSFTYQTDATRRRATVYRGNYRLRSLGMTPTPVGVSPVRDSVTSVAMRGLASVRRLALRARGLPLPPDTSTRYAEPGS
jgi:hypothetical protein